MDKRIIEAKLESLRRCIGRIEQKTPQNSDALKNDYDLQDIISVNLERAVQQCVDIASHIIASSENEAPDTMAKTFQVLFDMNILTQHTAEIMKKTVGFRNIAVHNYSDINWEIVFNICQKQLSDFKAFAKEVYKNIA
jgi:uncharacterized protein YutE (UPF0331/DUF86 family)